MDKSILFEKVLKKLQADIAKDENALIGLRQASIEAPGAMQSHSDTNKFQSGNMANSLASLIEDKYRALERIKALSETTERSPAVALGSIVEIEDLDKNKVFNYFVAPGFGGIEIDYEEMKILLIAESAPLAQCILGKKPGEIAEFKTSAGLSVRRMKITSIS